MERSGPLPLPSLRQKLSASLLAGFLMGHPRGSSAHHGRMTGAGAGPEGACCSGVQQGVATFWGKIRP